ncbi:hypothetical protein [Paenibacillus eucommiae]|uniref:Uncharacterized protein n=1 Tax=Paenibacillus eucommiae TaxID=1355755 RepID=A0ABS4IVY7_9BACL|nr:hypothetical protein [Paenibacillus eucommiae]MBP1991678.1 hypothetical protein [Paenibacillus eucommiae]
MTLELYGGKGCGLQPLLKICSLEWNGCRGWNKSLKADAIALPPTPLTSFSYNRTNTKLKWTASKGFSLAGGDFLAGEGAGAVDEERPLPEHAAKKDLAHLAMFFIVKCTRSSPYPTLTMKNIVK